MKWVGLTGGIASGKSTVSNLIREFGIPVVCADTLSRQATELNSPSYQQIVQHFGHDILADDLSIDRKKLGKIAFANPAELRFIENVVHPVIRASAIAARTKLELEGCELAVYDVPLLFEMKLESQFDNIIVVYCSREIQIERLAKRNGFTKAEALQRLNQQVSTEYALSKATHRIKNDGSLEWLEEQARRIIGSFCHA